MNILSSWSSYLAPWAGCIPVTLFSIRHVFGLGIVFDYRFKQESDRKILVTDLMPDEKSEEHVANDESNDTSPQVASGNHSVRIRKGAIPSDTFENAGRYFIVGLPHSGKNQLIRSFLTWKEKHIGDRSSH